MLQVEANLFNDILVSINFKGVSLVQIFNRYTNMGNDELTMNQCGYDQCRPNHSFGPEVRDYYLIHYIISGKGFYEVGNRTYHLSEGDGFLICPNIPTYYEADKKEPWGYTWIGFSGSKVKSYLMECSLSEEKPIFTYNNSNNLRKCFANIINIKPESNIQLEIRLYSLLYNFFSLISENKKDYVSKSYKDKYVQDALDYIHNHYSSNIKVADISNELGLNASYLGSLFKRYYNTSPKSYLVNYRVEKACELMWDNKKNIGEIAYSVGYSDPLLFSKMFKKIKGVSPTAYRNAISLN